MCKIFTSAEKAKDNYLKKGVTNMAIIASNTSSESTFDPLSEGIHTAVCFGVIDMGVQEFTFEGKIIKNRKVRLMWEIPEETYENKDGEAKIKTIGKEYTLSLHEMSNLRKILESWRGKSFSDDELVGFDLCSILNKGCQLQIIHEKKSDKVYSKITTVIPLPKNTKIKATYPLVYFDLSVDSLTEEMEAQIETFPDFLKTKIRESETYLTLKYGVKHHDTDLVGDDEIPF